MSMKQIVITVEADGATKIDAQNFAGQGCKSATEAIAIAIGGSDRDRSGDDTKPEFYATESQSTGQTY